MKIERTERADALPPEWNILAESYFQQTPFLQYLEKYNPCRQRYYLCFNQGVPVAAAVLYSLPVNLFSFAGLTLALQMQIAGIPCSVSGSGIFGTKAGVAALERHLFNTEKGFVLMLNREEKPPENGNASGKTLPTIVFENRFSGWDDYLASLTAPYRRRLKKLTVNHGELRFITIACADFTETMYRQYEHVFRRSRAKLEKLSIDFFRNLPPEFRLTTCVHNNSVIGWNIALESNGTYYFFLGGVDYRLNKTHNTYLRLLAQLMRNGIESKAHVIDLGQTAETPKTRFGGRPHTLYMQARHSNPIVNTVLKMGAPLLEYNRKTEKNNPMKPTTR